MQASTSSVSTCSFVVASIISPSGSLDAGLLEPELLRVRHAARRDHAGVDFERFDVFLRSSINHLDDDRFLADLARRDFRREDVRPVVDASICE